jgi:hypothetical protein
MYMISHFTQNEIWFNKKGRTVSNLSIYFAIFIQVNTPHLRLINIMPT